MPPPKPKMTSERKKPENPGLLQGAPRASRRCPREALGAHRDLDRSRHGEAVDHRRQHGQVHRIGGVPDLPARADAGIHQEVVGRGEVDEEDVENERAATDRLVQRLGAHRQRAEQVPDRDHRADVDLLGHVPESPPGNAIPGGIDRFLDDAHRPEQVGIITTAPCSSVTTAMIAAAVGAEDHERNRALVGLVPLRDVDRREVVDDAESSAPTATRMMPR